MSQDTDRKLLVDGARLLQEGRIDEARTLLLQYVEKHEDSEEGWLWLSGAVTDPADVEVALDNCLHSNPNNLRAIQGKQWLHSYQQNQD